MLKNLFGSKDLSLEQKEASQNLSVKPGETIFHFNSTNESFYIEKQCK